MPKKYLVYSFFITLITSISINSTGRNFDNKIAKLTLQDNSVSQIVTILNKLMLEPIAGSMLLSEANAETQKSSHKKYKGMVFIKGGSFEMGDTFGDGKRNELPVHKVIVSDFYLSKTEVTVAEFQSFCNSTGRAMPRQPAWNYEDHPVVSVSWHDANAYCKWIGAKLPTEAEWEYAARNGGEKVKYPNGNKLTNNDANFIGVSGIDQWTKTSPVASFAPNKLGIYDMAGNVSEWCADWYDEDYYRRSPKNDPTGPSVGRERVLRGGSWLLGETALRTTYRNHNVPTMKHNRVIGFRYAR